MQLYPYQHNAILAIENDPSHSQLISMPTGTGKTITFLSAIKRKNKKCLVLVHREELLNQTYDKAKLCGFEKENISLIKSDNKPELKNLNIAMIQTLSRNLDKYDPSNIEMIVIDEAHHATSSSYIKVLEYFRVFQEGKILLGFTATPLRGDKAALSSIFISHSFKMTLSEATQNGYICPVHGLRVDMKRSLDKIDTVQGDYDITQLDKVMNCDEINSLISDKCEHLMKTPGIIFCTSIDHAKNIAKKLRDKKRKAISVSYQTSKKTLDRIFKMLNQGKIDFITNAVKLSEGFDHPPIQTVVIARPTRSPVLYKQMIGRGLRKYPDKHDCFVLEFGGNDEKMMRWEDIDENCTFQSYSIEQKKNREEALKFYKARFTSPDIKIIDVRISPFNFYECYVRRLVKYKKIFYYMPHQTGFTIFKLFPVDAKYGGNFYNIFLWVCAWKKKYESFKFYFNESENIFYYYEHMGHSLQECEKRMNYFGEIQKMGRWYPSEEEPMTRYQKKIAKEIFSARKAEMFIEDKFIKKAIDQHFIENEPHGIMEVRI